MSGGSGLRRAVGTAVGGLPRTFWWLWFATFVNRLGGFVATFLTLYLTVERGYSASYAGLVVALSGAGGVGGTLVGGVLADRVGRRPTLLASQLTTGASTALLGFTGGRVAIAVVACLVGFVSSATRPAVAAVIADVVPPGSRSRAFALNYWAFNIGFAMSAAVAGLIAAHGYLPLFLGEAAATVVCAGVLFLRLPESRPATAATGGGDGGPGLGQVLLDRPFMVLVALTFLLAAVQVQANTTLAVSMARSGLSSAEYGLVIGLNGLLVALLQIPLTHAFAHRDRGRALCTAALLVGWGFGLVSVADSVAVYALTVVIWTVGEIVQAPIAIAMAVDLSPASARGRYQGVYTFALAAATVVGPAVGGLLLDHGGKPAVWLSCGAVGTAVAVGYLLLIRRHQATPEPVPGPLPAVSP